MDTKRLQELAGIESLEEGERLRDSKHIKELQTYINNLDHIGEEILDAIFEKVGPDLSHYYFVKEIKLGFDWQSYESDMREEGK